MTTVEMTEKVQDGVMKAVETSQRWTLGALKSTTSAFDMAKPDLSKVPFSDQMPSAVEAIDMTYAFAARLLEAQHAFMLGLVGLSEPTVVAPSTGTAKKS